MIKNLLSVILSLVFLITTTFCPYQASAESVYNMSADELEAYIAYLQIVLQNKRKEEGSTSAPIIPQATEAPIEEKFNVIFNAKIYTGTYEGDQQDGVPHGNGTFVGYYQQNKLVYTGQWIHGEMTGAGTVEAEAYTLHFDITEGIFDRTGSYAGDVVNGLPEGNGTFKTTDGNSNHWEYTGEWKGGLFNGQGTKTLGNDSTVMVGTFTNNEFTPTAAEAFTYTARKRGFNISAKSKEALVTYSDCFTGQQQDIAPSTDYIDADFDLKQYKKKPNEYGDKLVWVSKASVIQVFTWEIGNKTVEQILMETKDGTIYQGFYYGQSDVVEDMVISVYVLPFDWATYKNVNNTDIWAVFCAISDLTGINTIGYSANTQSDEVSHSYYQQAEVLLANKDLAGALAAYQKAGNYADAIEKQRSIYATFASMISAGQYHSVGLRANGRAIATGSNGSGQSMVTAWRDIVSIAAGSLYTVGLKADGTVVATGDNSEGACSVRSWKNIVAIAVGDYHTVGLKENGTVVAIGSDYAGACDVHAWTDIVAIAADNSVTVGLRSDGTVLAVGNNKTGQCNVAEWENIVAVTIGGSCTMGLKNNGTVVVAGNYDLAAFEDWYDIAAVIGRENHLIGFKVDGTRLIYAKCRHPNQCIICNSTDVVAFSEDSGHILLLNSDGTVQASGPNEKGQNNVRKWNLLQ